MGSAAESDLQVERNLSGVERRGFALVKHCAWLGIEIGFIILALVAAIAFLGITVMIAYKSSTLGVSFGEFVAATEQRTRMTLFSLSLRCLGTVLAGTIFCGFVGASLGALAAALKRRGSNPNLPNS
jgi:hypothetical protein